MGSVIIIALFLVTVANQHDCTYFRADKEGYGYLFERGGDYCERTRKLDWDSRHTSRRQDTYYGEQYHHRDGGDGSNGSDSHYFGHRDEH